MGANMLDTYTLVKRLIQAGIPEAQAEAHMSVFLDMSERGFATKGDIAELGKRIDDLATHIAGMELRLSGVERRLTAVETRLSDMDGRLTAVETRLSDMDGRLTAVEARLSGMEARLSGMELRLSGMEMRLMVRLGGLIVALMSAGFGVLEFTLAH